MSANPPADGMFFVDQPQPGEPAAAPVPAPAPAPAPAPEALPTAPQDAPADVKSGGMRDVPLGTLIFRAGLLAEEQVEDALQEGMRTGKRLGEVLLERGWLHERDLGRLLAGQKGLPFIELGAVSPDPAAVHLLNEEKARFQTALPIGFEDGVPVVAVADPSNNLVIENLRRALNTEPRLVVAAYSELARKIDHAYAALAAPVPQPALDPQVVVTPPVETPAPFAAPAPAAEPVAEQPPAPAVTPMPAVLPPAETRVPEPIESVALPVVEPAAVTSPELEALAVEPVVAQPVTPPPTVDPAAPPLTVYPATEEVAPLQHAATPEPQATQPPAVEPPAVPPAPEVDPIHFAPAAALPATEAPAPLLETASVEAPEPPVSEQFVVEQPQPVVEQPPVEQLPETPVSEQFVVEQPQPMVEQPPVEQLPETPVTAQPFVEQPQPVVEQPPVEQPALETSPNGTPAPSNPHFVVLRLSDGEHLEIGKFGGGDEAQGFAQEVVRQIAATEGESAWPFFAGRYLRPETIVSVDVIAESQERWMGSQMRSRWAQ